MTSESNRMQLIDNVVSLTRDKSSLLSKFLLDSDGESSGLVSKADIINCCIDHFLQDTFVNDPEFAQFMDSVKDLEECASKTQQLLLELGKSEDAVSFIENKSLDPDGIFSQLDTLKHAVGELEYEMAKECLDYPQLVSIIEVIREELENTSEYHNVPPLDSLLQRYLCSRAKLKKMLFYRYREVGIFTDLSKTVSQYSEFSWIDELKGANFVIDAMGKDVAAELVEALIDFQLMPYHAKGRYVGGSLYSLRRETLEQRWDELYRMLGACSAVNIRSIVSVEWNLPYACYVAFCHRTAEHLKVLLDCEVEQFNLLETGHCKSKSSDAVIAQRQDHVTMLVKVLESVLNIENEVHKMFDKGVYTLFGANDSSGVGISSSAGRRLSASSRKGSRVFQKLTTEAKEEYRCYVMSSMIADNYMDPYVQAERRNVEDALDALVKEDVKKTSSHLKTEISDSARGRSNSHVALSENEISVYTTSCLSVYDSAVVLFQITRSSMLRCASLSNGKPLMSLLLEYKVIFQVYAEMLRNLLCPSIPAEVADLSTATRKQRVPYPLSLPEEVMACRAITTADHCIGLIPQLEAEIAFKVCDKYKEDVQMKFQCELFDDVISYSIDILVSSLLGKVDDAAMVHMANTNWSKFTIVGDVSPYIFFMSRCLADALPRLRKVLPEDYFDTVCSRFSSDFLDRFLALVMGLRSLSVSGAQQLLLDVNELKPMLLNLHGIENSSNKSNRLKPVQKISSYYLEMVNKKSNLLATVLKLVLSDDKNIDEAFHALWPEGNSADLKIIKKLRSKDNNSYSQKDSDLNQYLDRRSFLCDESAYVEPKGVFGNLSSVFGSLRRNKKGS